MNIISEPQEEAYGKPLMGVPEWFPVTDGQVTSSSVDAVGAKSTSIRSNSSFLGIWYPSSWAFKR